MEGSWKMTAGGRCLFSPVRRFTRFLPTQYFPQSLLDHGDQQCDDGVRPVHLSSAPKWRGFVSASRFQIEREKQTIQQMIRIYCRGHRHSASGICDECRAVLGYAIDRINGCPYREGAKPACGLCRSNCFSKDMFQRFSVIMRYAGPRMAARHPVLTALHILDAIRGGRGR